MSRTPILETTPYSPGSSFHAETIKGRSYGAMWHFHPEHQITLVLKSDGHRVVGDHLAPLQSGDLVLVGSNLPHVWHQDARRDDSPEAVHAVVLRFRDDFLGQDFFQIQELARVRRLLDRASRGLHVTGATCVKLIPIITAIPQQSGLTRLVSLLSVLDILSTSNDVAPISSGDFSPALQESDSARMQRVMHLIDSNLDRELSRGEIAQCAGLSEGAFSRFFKARCGRTLPQYINELRIGRARAMLQNPELKISDIALDCGFNNLANFNRQFIRHTGLAPSRYRKTYQQQTSIRIQT